MDAKQIISKAIIRHIDKVVLYNMSRRIPTTLEPSCAHAGEFETILAQTAVNTQHTAVHQLTSAGEHKIQLTTPGSEYECRLLVRPAAEPTAPLIIYHHGFNEYPYTSSFKRIFTPLDLPYHLVCVQAPFHNNWLDPMSKGWATVDSMYQLFAGSLRLIEAVQEQFEKEGAGHTTMCGISWGGITAVLYEAIFQQTRAVIPMLSSPNLARVMLNSATLFGRQVTVTDAEVENLLNFNHYYHRCLPEKIFPLLGEHDLFFRYEEHAALFQERPLTKIPAGHITAMWRSGHIRQHITDTLAILDENFVSTA